MKNKNFRHQAIAHISTTKNTAFTLAETLITLGIIGVVAALTISTIVNKYKEMQYKTAYKKAYSDFANAFMHAKANGNVPDRSQSQDAQATAEEWAFIQSAFIVAKNCSNNISDCWVEADKICTGSCGGCIDEDNCPYGNGAPFSNSKAFIDASGRAWAQYTGNENIYLVDTNGNKSPNQYGKDRWVFTFMDEDKNRANSKPAVGIKNFADDQLTKNSWCNYPPCYYRSWLLN